MGLESQWGQRDPGPRVPTATDQGPMGDHRETSHLKVSHNLHADLVSTPCSSLAVKRKELYLEEHFSYLCWASAKWASYLLLFLNHHPSLGIAVNKWALFPNCVSLRMVMVCFNLSVLLVLKSFDGRIQRGHDENDDWGKMNLMAA